MTIYAAIADDIATQIERGVLRAGERLPSVRSLCGSRGVSMGSVLQAYYLLEDRGLISTKPRSGYFVNAATRRPLALPTPADEDARARDVSIGNILHTVLDGTKQKEDIPLGSAFISPALFPLRKLAQHLGVAARRMDPWRVVDDLPPGNAELRRHIARRYLEIGADVDPDEIVITNGASEALFISLFVLTKPGDAVAIETPAHYNVLHAIESSGRRAVCIPTCARLGMNIDSLERAFEVQPFAAVWAMPTFQSPTGGTMSIERKRHLADFVERHEIPLIENDVYGELYYGEGRPAPVKSFDRRGLVLHCGSFSKHLAPGYRIGWVAPGRFFETVRQQKFMLSISTNVPAQAALADFVKHGGYELHLRRLRSTLLSNRDCLLRAIARYFPTETRVSRPEGGYFLWLQLPNGAPDAVELLGKALEEGISIAPGALFSPDANFGSYLRLTYGFPWSAQIERAVQALGRIVHESTAGEAVERGGHATGL